MVGNAWAPLGPASGQMSGEDMAPFGPAIRHLNEDVADDKVGEPALVQCDELCKEEGVNVLLDGGGSSGETEQALTAAPLFNPMQRRAVEALLGEVPEDSGGRLHADLRQFSLGLLPLGDYLGRLDGVILGLRMYFPQGNSYVRPWEELRRALASP